MKIRWIIIATLVAVLAHDTIGGRNIFAASAPLKAIFTFGGLNERSGILWVARDAGIFQKHGIDPTIVNVRNAQVGMSALAGGETQFHVGSATGTSIGAMAGGLDLAFIAGLINKLDGAFVVNPEHSIAGGPQGQTDRRAEHRWWRLDVHHARLRALGARSRSR